MTPARHPRAAEKLLRIDRASGRWAAGAVEELPGFFAANDLLVVNDAATLPASLAGVTFSGDPVEIRLLEPLRSDQSFGSGWSAIALGAGDWRERTEDRPAPLWGRRDSRKIRFGEDLSAEIISIDARSARLVKLRFSLPGAELLRAIYRYGRPIQYSHLSGSLELFFVQNGFSSRPWAMEMPSAGRPLRWELLLALRRRGVRLAAITHAAGISSSGDPALDARLPLGERYEIPQETALAVRETRRRGGRVIAAGTSVVRALESAARSRGRVRAGSGRTELRIGRGHRLRVVDGILTGMHEAPESHFDLLQAFAPEEVLRGAHEEAERKQFLSHEFGDACLIVAGAA